jgi:hypothetical protein
VRQICIATLAGPLCARICSLICASYETRLVAGNNCISNVLGTLYINIHSNHPPSITRQLPTAINKRIALLSSDEQTSNESTPIYQNALRHSNFDHEFTYTQDASQRTRRNRQRNIIWFNQPAIAIIIYSFVL